MTARCGVPHVVAGGQRQRIAIACLDVAAEAAGCRRVGSAFDMSAQAQVLNLMVHLQRELRVADLFISNDFGLVRHIADD